MSEIREFLENLEDRNSQSVLDVVDQLDGTKCVSFGRKVVKPLQADSALRRHNLCSYSGFTGFIDKYSSDNTVLFVDFIQRRFFGVLDDRKKEGGYEIIAAKPSYHAILKEWRSVLDYWRGLDDFVEILTKLRLSIDNSREMIFMFKNLKVGKNIQSISAFGGVGHNAVSMDVSINSTTKQQTLDLPESFVVSCPLMVEDEEKVEFTIDILLKVDSDNVPMIKLFSADLEDKVDKRFMEYSQHLHDYYNEDDGILVVDGEPNYSDVSYERGR